MEMVILIPKIEFVRVVVRYNIFGDNESWYFISSLIFTF